MHIRCSLETAEGCLAQPVYEGTAWCVATKSAKPFEGVVVPPVPLNVHDMEVASARWKAAKERSKRRQVCLVRPDDAEASPRFARSVELPLMVSEGQAAVEEYLAGAFGRQLKASFLPGSGTSGDAGPILGEGVRLAQDVLVQQFGWSSEGQRVTSIEAEVVPLPSGTQVQLCARVGEIRAGGIAEVLVTGWLLDKPVLRLRVSWRAEVGRCFGLTCVRSSRVDLGLPLSFGPSRLSNKAAGEAVAVHLKDWRSAVRRSALAAISRLFAGGAARPSLVKILLPCLEDPDAGIRSIVAQTLPDVAKSDEKVAIDDMMARLKTGGAAKTNEAQLAACEAGLLQLGGDFVCKTSLSAGLRMIVISLYCSLTSAAIAESVKHTQAFQSRWDACWYQL
ncbi:unnamed protein product [Polarella glacialis]|uniref:Uncharacterized protein n=1 Tax=Polarella glacialis TaxID=89957 RepID=A0A813IC78_POLGL|nr:unnamed protein product [Polarella glacialis]